LEWIPGAFIPAFAGPAARPPKPRRVPPKNMNSTEEKNPAAWTSDDELFALARALEKARGEKTVLKAIQGGMGAREVFDTFGIM